MFKFIVIESQKQDKKIANESTAVVATNTRRGRQWRGWRVGVGWEGLSVVNLTSK